MNPDVGLTLDEAVGEVLGQLYGLSLDYRPELDRYRSVTRCLNRALRANALEQEWSCYAATTSLGAATAGVRSVPLSATLRPRIINDDAVRLVDTAGNSVVWAYFLPRDALHKYPDRGGLWCAATGSTLEFSRPFSTGEDGLDIQLPMMREPVMFRLPDQPEDPSLPLVTVDPAIRAQQVDFAWPDVIVARACYYYAQTDPVLQPRVQTLEGDYKDLMYQLIERDTANTDSPYENEFFVPVQNGLRPGSSPMSHWHPHADERR